MLDETSQLIAEDPTIYSYDAHYDQIKEKRQEIEEQKRQKVHIDFDLSYNFFLDWSQAYTEYYEDC